jgi:hypothetical protein
MPMFQALCHEHAKSPLALPGLAWREHCFPWLI